MTKQNDTTHDGLRISPSQLAAFTNQLVRGESIVRENEEHPLPPGPWDPVIRKVHTKVFGSGIPWHSDVGVLERLLGIIAARHPAIFDVIGGDRFTRAALNPQPLPPRAAFLVAFIDEVVDRVLIMQEVADGMDQTAGRKGIIIVGGRLSLLVDELCGNNFKVRIPLPRPRNDPDDRLSGMELMVAGAALEENAASVAHEQLRQDLHHAATMVIEAGIARL